MYHCTRNLRANSGCKSDQPDYTSVRAMRLWPLASLHIPQGEKDHEADRPHHPDCIATYRWLHRRERQPSDAAVGRGLCERHGASRGLLRSRPDVFPGTGVQREVALVPNFALASVRGPA